MSSREPTEAQINALRAAFESHFSREPFYWRNFSRDSNGDYTVGSIRTAWYGVRMGFAVGINASGVKGPGHG